MYSKSKNLKFGRRQAFYNMASQGLAFAVTLLFGFFLTPFIVRHIGSTANGFFGLANSVTTYASLVVIALNSMAGRFIAMAYFQHNMLDVQKYYSSVFVADIFICLVLTLPAILFLVFLPSIIHVPSELRQDVFFLFLLTFVMFGITQIGGVFNNSAYVVNRLELIASRNVESKILNVGLIFLVFWLFTPHLWQIGLIHCIATIYGVARNYFIHRSVMPEVQIRYRYFDIVKVRELVASGIWNSISSLGSILLDQLDLLIVNLFISAAAMGIVSVAKVIPLCITGLICSLASSVAPALTKEYAEGNFDKIGKNLHFNMRLMGFFSIIPVAFLVVFGREFFHLWVPGMEARELWLIALGCVALMPLNLSALPLGLVFTSANKVRTNSLVTIGYALVSLGAMFFTLRLTDDTLSRMLIVVAVSKIFTVLQNITFVIPYIAKLLSMRLRPFYFVLLRNSAVAILVTGICFCLRCLFPVSSWITTILAGGVTALIGTIFCWLLLFSKEEKNILTGFLKTKLHIG